MQIDWSHGALAEGLQCYRKEEFFLAHEHWESVWLGSPEPEKTFLQALIQMTAAFHLLQRRNSTGAASLLRAALRRLEPYPADFGGIAVAPLRESIGAWLQALDAQDTSLRPPFPRIQITCEDLQKSIDTVRKS
jgi:predicted metal-dependent hydrolase